MGMGTDLPLSPKNGLLLGSVLRVAILISNSYLVILELSSFLYLLNKQNSSRVAIHGGTCLYFYH